MVNSWSLLYDELNMEHSSYYYEYDRNDPNRKEMEVKADGWSTSEDGIIGLGEDKITFNLNFLKWLIMIMVVGSIMKMLF